MESNKCKTNASVAEAEYQKALQSEEKEKQLLCQLMKIKFYSNKTILDDLIEKSKKRLNEFKIHVEELENVLGCKQNKETVETGKNVSVKNEDMKSRNNNLQDDVSECKGTASVDDLPSEIAKCECKEREHLEIAKENFDEVSHPISSCCETPLVNANAGDDDQKSDEISHSQITVPSEQHVQSEIKIDQPDEGNISEQISTSKETILVNLSGLPTLKEPHHEDVKAAFFDVEHQALSGVCDSNKDTRVSVKMVDANTKETVEKLENNLNQIDVSTGEEPKTTSDAVLLLTTDDKLKTIDVENAVQISKKVELTYPKTTDISTNIVDQTHFDQPTRHTERERCARADLDIQIVKNESSEVGVRNDGCSLSSSVLTCSVRLNTDIVPSSRVETTSTQMLSAGSPDRCKEPRPGCVDMESVASAEQVVTNSPLRSTSSDKNSDKDYVKDKSHVEVKQDDVNIVEKKEFKKYENKVEDCKMNVSASNMLIRCKDGQGNYKCKQTKRDKNKEKKTRMVKVEKKGKCSKDDKAADKAKSKKFRNRLVSMFCFCFTSQERNKQNNETEQSTAEKTKNQDTSQNSFVTVDLSS